MTHKSRLLKGNAQCNNAKKNIKTRGKPSYTYNYAEDVCERRPYEEFVCSATLNKFKSIEECEDGKTIILDKQLF